MYTTLTSADRGCSGTFRIPLLFRKLRRFVYLVRMGAGRLGGASECVGLAMVSHCTKFEVSRFTCYEAVNGGAKCRKWGALGWLGALKVIGNVTIRQSTYDFLFDFNRNYVSILYRFRDIAGYWSKVTVTHLYNMSMNLGTRRRSTVHTIDAS